MRKTRLVILPTKCLHQMGFLLLFLSCPVIGDWGRIRPESETLHKAIQVDREGTCGLQRDPPGGLLDGVDERGSKQCRLSEDFDLNTITKKQREVRSVERRDSLQRSQRDSERRNSQRAAERIANDRRNVRMNSQRRVGSERREIGERDVRRVVRSRSAEFRSARRLDNEQAVRRQRQVTRTVRTDNESRNERELQSRSDRRSERIFRTERRESERVRTAENTRERQTRLTEDNRRSVRGRENSQTRERSLDRQTERLSLARREQETRRNTDNRDSHTRKSLENLDDQRRTQSRGSDRNRRLTLSPKQREVRVDTLELKTRRAISATNYKNPLEETAHPEITKFLDFQKFDSILVGDWTTNCVIGAVVYFLSTRQIKAV